MLWTGSSWLSTLLRGLRSSPGLSFHFLAYGKREVEASPALVGAGLREKEGEAQFGALELAPGEPENIPALALGTPNSPQDLREQNSTPLAPVLQFPQRLPFPPSTLPRRSTPHSPPGLPSCSRIGWTVSSLNFRDQRAGTLGAVGRPLMLMWDSPPQPPVRCSALKDIHTWSVHVGVTAPSEIPGQPVQCSAPQKPEK